MIVIDWKLLREQKSWLLSTVDASPSTTQVNNALGLVHLLDALQDHAVEIGVPESQVFGLEYEHMEDFPGGTCLQGHVNVTYEKLVSCFGEPTCDGDAYKVQAEWCLRFRDGTIATIYDWKEGDAYCGPGQGRPAQEVTDWHIGGHNQRAVDCVQEFLAAH